MSAPSMRHRRLALFSGLLVLGCGGEPTTPIQPSATAGVMEITITGIGTPRPAASARALAGWGLPSAGAASAPNAPQRSPQGTMAQALTLLPSPGTVELDPVSVASFTLGGRPGGFRYVSATFRVRNAAADSTAYLTTRTNLTFLAVRSASTLEGSAMVQVLKFDGTAVAAGVADSILPTGWANLNGNAGLTTRAPDVLQGFTEAEAASFTPPSGVSPFPYGFLVRNPNSTGDRSLGANPGPAQFDGLVTFSFKVPLQGAAADDPFTITGLFLAVDDDQAWVLQSREDTDAVSVSALSARGTALSASVASLVGTGGGFPSATPLCIRTAGTVASPTVREGVCPP